MDDQLRVIVDSLGRCDDLDMSFLTNGKSKQYFELMNKGAPSKPQAPLQKLIQLKDPVLQSILKPMLEINPYFRPSARELLSNNYFDDIRIPALEALSIHKL